MYVYIFSITFKKKRIMKLSVKDFFFSSDSNLRLNVSTTVTLVTSPREETAEVRHREYCSGFFSDPFELRIKWVYSVLCNRARCVCVSGVSVWSRQWRRNRSRSGSLSELSSLMSESPRNRKKMKLSRTERKRRWRRGEKQHFIKFSSLMTVAGSILMFILYKYASGVSFWWGRPVHACAV